MSSGLALKRDTKHPGMVRVPRGTFQMGSNRHYPEEAPSHRVIVDGFWIGSTPVTNQRRPARGKSSQRHLGSEVPLQEC